LGIDDLLKHFGISAESVNRIRLGRGVVGKTTSAVVVVLLVLAVAIYKLSDPKLVLLLAGLVSLIFIIYFVGVLRFADKNPGAALLEGAELLQWKQFDMEAKGLPEVPGVPVTTSFTLTYPFAPPKDETPESE
jgi:hypothetical protein